MEHWTAAGFSAKAKSTHRDQKTARQAIPKDVSFWLIKRFSSLSSVCYLAAMKAILITVALLATGVIAEAQQANKVFKIGWLTTAPDRSITSPKELHPLGYVESKNIFIEYRSARSNPERLQALADELVRLKVDVIVAIGTDSAVAAKNATKTIPIVFTSGTDPAVIGLVDSLARPGGNLTGITAVSDDLAGKRLELL